MAGELIRKCRRYSDAERRSIVAECAVPGASVARVARRHGVNANQVYRWRHRFQLERSPEVWLPVMADRALPATQPGAGTLEIVLATGPLFG